MLANQGYTSVNDLRLWVWHTLGFRTELWVASGSLPSSSACWSVCSASIFLLLLLLLCFYSLLSHPWACLFLSLLLHFSSSSSSSSPPLPAAAKRQVTAQHTVSRYTIAVTAVLPNWLEQQERTRLRHSYQRTWSGHSQHSQLQCLPVSSVLQQPSLLLLLLLVPAQRHAPDMRGAQPKNCHCEMTGVCDVTIFGLPRRPTWTNRSGSSSSSSKRRRLHFREGTCCCAHGTVATAASERLGKQCEEEACGKRKDTRKDREIFC